MLIIYSTATVVFLERLQSYDALPPAHIAHLGNLYGVASTPNAEVRQRFYEVALQDPTTGGAKAFAEDAAKWVVGNDATGVIKGRMKFCRPTFRGVAKVNKDLAVKTFAAHKMEFHPIAQKLIEKVSLYFEIPIPNLKLIDVAGSGYCVRFLGVPVM